MKSSRKFGLLVAVLAVALVGGAASSADAGGIYFGISPSYGYGGYHGGYGGYRVQSYYGGGYGHGHGHGRSYYHDTSHYDYHPGGYYRHGNHYHYQPGHYDWHQTGHWHHR